MIVIKNRRLDTNTLNVLNEVAEIELSPNTALKLSRIIRELENFLLIKNSNESKVIGKYASIDENGALIVGKDKNGNIIPNSFELRDGGKAAEFNKEMEKIAEVENTILVDKLSIYELKLDKISTNRIMKIDFLFES